MQDSNDTPGLGFRILLYSFGLVWGLHMVAEILHLTLRSCPPLGMERLFGFDAMFLNVPFSFSVGLLVYNAGLAFRIGYESRSKGALEEGWWMLGAGCLAIVAVMLVGSREVAESLLFTARRFPLPFIGIVVVASVLGILFARFVWRQPPSVRGRLLVAGGLYLLGAVALELVSEFYCGRRHEPGVAVIYAAVSTAEETCEMLGILLSIRALRLHRFALGREAASPLVCG